MKEQLHDTFYTPAGLLRVEHLAHGSVHLDWEGMHIYVDPFSQLYDFSNMKKADLILLTHAHTDHYDCRAIADIAAPGTEFIVSKAVGTALEHDLTRMELNLDANPLNVDPDTTLENMTRTVGCIRECPVTVLQNGEKTSCKGLNIEAVPAYNLKQKRENGNPYHIKGEGNGYLLERDGFRVYIAGDTEFIPEMELAGGCDIAFLPKNLPFTLSDEDFVEAANFIRPKNLYPIHYFEIDPEQLRKRLDTGICLHVND